MLVGLTKPIRFDWDKGNLEHTAKYGVSPPEIEHVFLNDPMITSDPHPATVEERWRAIGKTPEGRYVFTVFVFRALEVELCIRPIAARDMHRTEIESDEQG